LHRRPSGYGDGVPPLPPSLRPASAAEVAERLEASRRGVPFLVLRDGEGRQRLVDLGERDGARAIGRQPSTDIPLAWDTEVSRVHAVLEAIGDEWVLVDDGLSRNGSFVNGERIHGRHRLRDGDVIRLGGSLLAYMAAGNEELMATARTRELEPPPLSPAQQRVLSALCRPLAAGAFAAPASNREIADALVISVDTVKSHLHDLFALFGVADMPQNRKRAELARRALERGAVPAL
jgi:DNA-binding CsgD family transcriptional regulator